MLHFVVAVARSRWRGVDRRVVDLLGSGQCVSKRSPTEHAHWSTNRGAVQIGAWHDDDGPPLWRPTQTGITAIVGEPVAVERRIATDAELIDFVDTDPRPLSAIAAEMEGLYALLRLRAGERSEIVTDPLGVQAIYTAETANTTLFSNRASLLAAVIEAETGHRPEPDRLGMELVALLGHMAGDVTGYEGISTLPFGCGITIDSRRVGVQLTCPHPWDAEPIPGGPTEEAIDAIEDRMIRCVHAVIRRYPDDPHAELTAGRDSRLVLALLTRAGVVDDISFYTRGGVGSPDVRGATAIAENLGLNFRRVSWPIPPEGYLASYEAHVDRVSGQLGCWESSESRGESHATFGGQFGEMTRAVRVNTTGVGDVDEILRRTERILRGRAGPMRALALEEALACIRQLHLEPLSRGYPAEMIADMYHLNHTMRRWLGAQPDRHTRHFFPLYVRGVAELAFACGPRARLDDRIRNALMARAGLGLSELDFSNPDKSGAAPEFPKKRHAAFPVDRGEQVALAKGALGVPHRIASTVGTRREAVERVFGAAETGDGFDIIDRARFLDWLRRYDQLTHMERIRLHWALTPVMWMR